MCFAHFRHLGLVASLSLWLGCSGGETPSSPSADGSPAKGTDAAQADGAAADGATAEAAGDDVRKVPSASLPPTQGLSPMLDGGRLQIPLLAKWVVPPRTSEWLFRLQRDRKTAYPQILVTVDEAFVPQVEKLNKSNVAEFVPVWQAHLSKSHKEDVFGEKVSAVRIGKKYGVECLINSAAGKMSVEQLMVTMVGAGRAYTLELRTQRGTLEDYRMDFYAVVAGTNIEVPAETPDGLGPMKETPAEESGAAKDDAAQPLKNDAQ